MAGTDALTSGQQQALDELREIAAADPTALRILDVRQPEPPGALQILVSVGTAHAAAALDATTAVATGPRCRVRARERFWLLVPRNFPFERPEVWTPHARFAGLPHVQWRRYLCLYVSPTTEWQPSDGMFGFFDRLLSWIERAATGTLDPAGEPLHPPVAYHSRHAGRVIVRADTPSVKTVPWVGFAILQQVSRTRADLVGWVDIAGARHLLATPSTDALSAAIGFNVAETPCQLGLAILLPKPTAYEFPDRARALVEMLIAQGVDLDTLLDGFTLAAYLTRRLAAGVAMEADSFTSVYAIIGTPMRGVAGGERRQHLAVWCLAELGRELVQHLDTTLSVAPDRDDLLAQARDLMRRWLDVAEMDWAHLYEDRPEVTTRRDTGSPLDVVRGRRVLLLGCGAIGGHAAEHLVRAGAARIVLVDRGRVSPGVLVRQPYDDIDIGRPKAEALADRLRRIRPGTVIETRVGDALSFALGDNGDQSDMDVIVDATASPSVTAWLEQQRWRRVAAMPPVLTVLLGHTARRGLVTVSPRGYSGGGVDLLRKVKIATLAEPGLQAFAEDFFPDPPRATYFQPEPGCSEVTFVGSDAEVAALTAMLLTHAFPACVQVADPIAGHAVLADLGLDDAPARLRRLTWPMDIVVRDAAGGPEVRLSAGALAEMRAECRLMARLRNARVETGGILLGEIDDACGVAWVSTITGPPPDSRASEQVFVCGIEGVDELVERRDRRTRGAERFLGIWHSHPGGSTAPTDIDESGMHDLLVPVEHAPRRAFLLIVGATRDSWLAWLHSNDGANAVPPGLYARLCRRLQGAREASTPPGGRYAEVLAAAGKSQTRRWPPPSSPRGQPQRQQWRPLRWRGSVDA